MRRPRHHAPFSTTDASSSAPLIHASWSAPYASELALRPPQFAAEDAYYAGMESARPATGGRETDGTMARTSLKGSQGPYKDFEAR